MGRYMLGDGHMICGKVAYLVRRAYFGYNNKEFETQSFYVLVEHARQYMRTSLSGVEQPKRAPILQQQDEYY